MKIKDLKVKDKKPLDKKTYSISDIAKKHNVDEKVIKDQLKKGIKVEREHTKEDNAAEEIALDHLWELPDYYTKLNKMEKNGEEKE